MEQKKTAGQYPAEQQLYNRRKEDENSFIGWLVYYFFFAKDYEELDETLFEGKEKEPVTEQPAEEKAEENCAEEAVQEACSPEAEPAEEPAAEV